LLGPRPGSVALCSDGTAAGRPHDAVPDRSWLQGAADGMAADRLLAGVPGCPNPGRAAARAGTATRRPGDVDAVSPGRSGGGAAEQPGRDHVAQLCRGGYPAARLLSGAGVSDTGRAGV